MDWVGCEVTATQQQQRNDKSISNTKSLFCFKLKMHRRKVMMARRSVIPSRA
jgi:hypothetical protein